MKAYLTRDRDEDGDLMPVVDVWLEAPRRVKNKTDKYGHNFGGYWIGECRTGEVSPEEALAKFGARVVSDRKLHEVDL